MTKTELKDLLTDAGADSIRSMIETLEDGAALAALGVTDDDTETVEDLYNDLRYGPSAQLDR